MGVVLDYISVKCNEAGHIKFSSLWVVSKGVGIKLTDSIVWELSRQYFRKPSGHTVVLGYQLWYGILSVDNQQVCFFDNAHFSFLSEFVGIIK